MSRHFEDDTPLLHESWKRFVGVKALKRTISLLKNHQNYEMLFHQALQMQKLMRRVYVKLTTTQLVYHSLFSA